MPRIALTKGRILEPALDWLARRGFAARAPEADRALRLPLGNGWEALLLKPADVPTFVQNGAADLGIVGSDTLEEDQSDVYDLRALGFGACRLSLAAPVDKDWHGASPLRVATKYPRLTRQLLGAAGFIPRVIRVTSSVELAPALGLSDVIVDLVDTGRTLAANGLREERALASIEAHLIANRRSYRFLDSRWWDG
ncbi:MAG: ATP phosphoribosyltransferase [Planctomycetes bacterium]|nr:ATP phosphoribosyltransferase [Planctomycetota bacterium]